MRRRGAGRGAGLLPSLRRAAGEPAAPRVPRTARSAEGRLLPVQPRRRRAHRPRAERRRTGRGAGAPGRGADRPCRGRELRADQRRRPGPGVRRRVVGESPAGGRLRRLRAGRVLPPRRAHPRGAGEAVVRAAPHEHHVHQLRESPRLREVQGCGALPSAGQEHRRPPVRAGLDDHQTVPGRAPRRPRDAVPQRAGADAADRQAADRGARGRVRDHHGGHETGRGAVARAAAAGVLVRAAQRAGPARPGPAGHPRRGPGGARRLPGAPVRQVQEPQDPVHEVAVGEPLLPQSRQRRRGVQPPARRRRGRGGQRGGARLPLPAQRRGPAHRRRTGPADRGLVHAAMGHRVRLRGRRRRAQAAQAALIDDTDGRLSAVPLTEATRRLDETWDNLFAYNTSPRPAEV